MSDFLFGKLDGGNLSFVCGVVGHVECINGEGSSLGFDFSGLKKGVGFSRLKLGTRLLGSVRRVKFRRTAPVRRRAVPLTLRKLSIVKRTRANANGATTFKLPVLRGVSGGGGIVRNVIVTPAHRLTVRARRRLCHLDHSGGMSIRIICNKTSVGHRVHTLGGGPRVVIKAPNHLLSRVGHGAVHLSRVRALILSRTSRVLGVNFLRSVRTVLDRAPTRHRALLFSTAVPSSVGGVNIGFVRTPRRIGVGTSRATTGLVSRCFIGYGSFRGFSAVAHLFSIRGPRLTVMFNHAGHHISRLSGNLRLHNCHTRNVRNSLARRGHVDMLGTFGANGLSVLMTASITTHKLSVSNIARMCGCSVPRSPRDCIRHVNHANHTNGRNVSIAFIAPGRVSCLHAVRGLAGGPVAPLRPPDSRRTFHNRIGATVSRIRALIGRARASGCGHTTIHLLRRRATRSLITTFLGDLSGSTASIPIGVAPRHPLPSEGNGNNNNCGNGNNNNCGNGHDSSSEHNNKRHNNRHDFGGGHSDSDGPHSNNGHCSRGHNNNDTNTPGGDDRDFAVHGGGSWSMVGGLFSG